MNVPLDFTESSGEKDHKLTKTEEFEAQLAIFISLASRAGLSKFQLTIVIMRYFDDLKPREIAVVLKVPAKRVIDGLYRARAKIKEVIIHQEQI